MTPLKLLDLFSGIGGFSLGLERSQAFKTVAFCEIEPFPRRVLAKHWPEVPCFEDVRTLTADALAKRGIAVDAICGGFPCQDISAAGKGAGIGGERSGLWREYARLIGELRPRIVVVENVSILRSRGLDVVLGTLAALGYDAEWHCIPASYVGAPHRRDRIWIVAYPHRERLEGRLITELQECPREQPVGQGGALANAHIDARDTRRPCDAGEGEGGGSSDRSPFGADVSDPDGESPRRLAITWGERREWELEPDVGRVAHGVPFRVDRLRGLGNAVVPQIPEMIGRAIKSHLEAQ